jgi:hypothetical protein
MVAGPEVIVDPAVARRKFEREVQPLVDDPEAFARIGMRPMLVAFPTVRVALPWRSRGIELGLQMSAPDWDYRPPSVDWVDLDGAPWPAGDAPSGDGFQQPNLNTRRPDRPWFCFRGSLEFHEYTGHSADAWWPIHSDERYRMLGFIQNVAAVLARR